MRLTKAANAAAAVILTVLVGGCASAPPSVPAAPQVPAALQVPLYVGHDVPPTPAELYANHFRTGTMQVERGGKLRFVACGARCLGATPKTLTTDLQQAVARRAAQRLPSGTRVPRAAARIVNPVIKTPALPAFGAGSPTPDLAASVPVATAVAPANIDAADSSDVLDMVTFARGSAWLTPNNRRLVEALARDWLQVFAAPQVPQDQSSPRRLRVVGFTSRSPETSAEANKHLARMRAESVRAVLIEHGVPASAVEIHHSASCCDIDTAVSDAARARNRRAEIHVL